MTTKKERNRQRLIDEICEIEPYELSDHLSIRKHGKHDYRYKICEAGLYLKEGYHACTGEYIINMRVRGWGYLIGAVERAVMVLDNPDLESNII